MQNPLTSLDELIWKQFEKVTQYAHKEYGWDKYDLANICNSTISCMTAGTGIYSAIADYSIGKVVSGTISVAGCTAISIYIGYLGKYKINKWREYDTKEFLNTGAIREPTFTGIRPAILSIPAMLYGLSILTAVGNNFLGDKQFNIEQYRAAVALGCFTTGTMGMSFISFWYFDEQLFTPPSTKKPFWRTTYEGIKNKFKPRPQLEPATEPVAKYGLDSKLSI